MTIYRPLGWSIRPLGVDIDHFENHWVNHTLYHLTHHQSELTGVTFSDSAPVPKYLNPDLGPEFFKFENLTPVQTQAAIEPTEILPLFLLEITT